MPGNASAAQAAASCLPVQALRPSPKIRLMAMEVSMFFFKAMTRRLNAKHFNFFVIQERMEKADGV